MPLVLCLSDGFRYFPCVCCAGVCALLSARPVVVACLAPPCPHSLVAPASSFPARPFCPPSLRSALMDGWMDVVGGCSQPARPPAVTPL